MPVSMRVSPAEVRDKPPPGTRFAEGFQTPFLLLSAGRESNLKMSHKLTSKSLRGRVSLQNSLSQGVDGLEKPYTAIRSDSDSASEVSLTCSGPLCGEKYRQTSAGRLYCSERCRLNAWHLREVSKLLERVTDDEALRIIRGALL
jgi:hypothetical protein